jgi:hypothetical protein
MLVAGGEDDVGSTDQDKMEGAQSGARYFEFRK